MFFFGAALVSLALVGATDAEVRWVPAALAVVYVLLALASFLDWRSSNR